MTNRENNTNHYKVKELNLSFSNITTWPNWIEPGEYSELEVLNIYSTKIAELPDSIGNLSELRELYLGQTEISRLPESIGNLSKLEVLHFNHTDIADLPESIGNLTSLRSIDAHGSEIEYLPESFGNLTALEHLYVFYMPLKELPESIGNLTNLKTLWIQQTNISKLPDSIGNLTNLADFRYDNELKEQLPESLKAKFYYKTHFDFFCKNSKRSQLFACQIFLKDNTLKLIENDHEMLNEVDEEQILYFKGLFGHCDYLRDEDEDDVRGFLWYDEVDSLSQRYNSKDVFISFSSDHSGYTIYSANKSPLDTYDIFWIQTLYDLIKEGISYTTVESLIPQLFQHYDKVLKPWAESHKEFLENWDGSINRFKKSRGKRED